MKKALWCFGVFTAIGIGLLMADTKVDYSHSTNFASFRTYSWLRVEAGNNLWTDRIRVAVDKELTAKGLTLQPSGGDLGVAAMGRTRQEQTYTTFYDNIGGGWFWRGLGPTTATTTVEETPIGTLTLDMFDASSKKLVWRGVSTKTLSDNPEKNEKKLEDAVNDMIKKFPPKGAAE